MSQGQGLVSTLGGTQQPHLQTIFHNLEFSDLEVNILENNRLNNNNIRMCVLMAFFSGRNGLTGLWDEVLVE